MTDDLRCLIKDYISQGQVVIQQGDNSLAKNFIKEVVSALETIIPNIKSGLEAYNMRGWSATGDFLHDLSILISKLKVCIACEGNYNLSKTEGIQLTNKIEGSGNSTNTNTNTTTQNQTVNSAFDIKVELDKVREEITADEVLDDSVKEEINERLNEIEEVMKGSQNNNEKWKKLKSTFSWIATKSYKVGQWIMPIITKALFPEE